MSQSTSALSATETAAPVTSPSTSVFSLRKITYAFTFLPFDDRDGSESDVRLNLWAEKAEATRKVGLVQLLALLNYSGMMLTGR